MNGLVFAIIMLLAIGIGFAVAEEEECAMQLLREWEEENREGNV